MAKKEPVKKTSAVKKTSKRKTVKPEARTPIELHDFLNEVNKRAYDIFERRSHSHGRDLDDWLQAEKEIKKKYGIKD